MDAVAPTAMDGVVVPTSAPAEARTPEAAADEYRRGTLTVGFITLLFASNSPALHAALTSMEHAPPPLMLNALCGIAALVGLLWGGPLLGQSTALPSTLESDATDAVDAVSVRAGGELGRWQAGHWDREELPVQRLNPRRVERSTRRVSGRMRW